jgi:hypothetical protein
VKHAIGEASFMSGAMNEEDKHRVFWKEQEVTFSEKRILISKKHVCPT